MALSIGKASILSICIFVIVSWIGAVIIMFLEQSGLKKQQSLAHQTNFTVQLQVFLRNKFSIDFNASNADLILKEVRSYFALDSRQASNFWKKEISVASVRKWHYFITATMSTVGYGDFYPETTGGKIFAIVFSLVGIPTCTYMIATLGGLFCTAFSTVKYRLKKGMMNKEVEHKVTIYCVMQCLAITLSFVVVTGILRAVDEGWSYLDGIYFSFITFTTIGYGDITPSPTPKWYSEIIGLVGIVGLVLMAMTLNTMVNLAEQKQNKTSPRGEEKSYCPPEKDLITATTKL